MGEWQPMETAPVDQSVLIYIPNAEHYGEGVYRALKKETVKKGVFVWMTTGLHHGSDLLRPGYQPTHWMPLPEPPSTNPDDLCFQCKERIATIPVYRAQACAPCYEAWLEEQTNAKA